MDQAAVKASILLRLGVGLGRGACLLACGGGAGEQDCAVQALLDAGLLWRPFYSATRPWTGADGGLNLVLDPRSALSGPLWPSRSYLCSALACRRICTPFLSFLLLTSSRIASLLAPRTPSFVVLLAPP